MEAAITRDRGEPSRDEFDGSPASKFPRIDYGNHPYYQEFEGADQLQRKDALTEFLPVYRAVQMKLRSRIPRVAMLFAPMAEELERDGFVALSPPRKEMNVIVGACAPLRRSLQDRIAQHRENQAKFRFRDTSVAITLEDHPEIYLPILGALENWNVFALFRGHLSSKTQRLASIFLRENVPGEDWATGVFRNPRIPDPPLVGLHIDSGTNQYLKALIYLNEVRSDQGPFHYIQGSHHWRISAFERTVRKSIDRIPRLNSRKEWCRRAFMALPPFLRHKAEFGTDVPPNSRMECILLDRQVQFTSEKNQVIVFDPEGCHRGGFVEEGSRSVLQITMMIDKPWKQPEWQRVTTRRSG